VASVVKLTTKFTEREAQRARRYCVLRLTFRLAKYKKKVVVIVVNFLFASFSLLITVIFVEKVNNGKGD